MGGLGNQMFQYAAGRRLATQHYVHLKLDVGGLNARRGVTKRQYELGGFAISEEFATADEIQALGWPDSRFRCLMDHLLKRCGSETSKHTFNESFFHFDPAFYTLSENVYLAGYWQSEKYFSGIEDIIRREFTVRLPIAGTDLIVADQIRNTCAVSIHVRRGDYVSSRQVAKLHGFCGLEYYASCIEDLARKVPNPHFFVFSDDPAWSRLHLSMKFPCTYIDHNCNGKGCEDLRLMSLCKHNIIANSTFSWWGAWLNENPEKLVYAPARWFNHNSANTVDLFPEGWIVL